MITLERRALTENTKETAQKIVGEIKNCLFHRVHSKCNFFILFLQLFWLWKISVKSKESSNLSEKWLFLLFKLLYEEQNMLRGTFTFIFLSKKATTY